MRLLFSITLVFFAVVNGPATQADLVLGLAFDDLTSSKVVSSGDSVLVDLFLTDTDGSTPMSAAGLSTAGGRLNQTAGAAVITDNLATILGVNAAPWLAFGFAPPAVGPTIAAATTIAPFLATVGVGATTIQIARFSLMVAGGAGETATITSAAVGIPFIGNISGIFPADTNLDPFITSFGSVDVTIAAAAVPEASTLFMALALGTGFIYRRRRNMITNTAKNVQAS